MRSVSIAEKGLNFFPNARASTLIELGAFIYLQNKRVQGGHSLTEQIAALAKCRTQHCHFSLKLSQYLGGPCRCGASISIGHELLHEHLCLPASNKDISKDIQHAQTSARVGVRQRIFNILWQCGSGNAKSVVAESFVETMEALRSAEDRKAEAEPSSVAQTRQLSVDAILLARKNAYTYLPSDIPNSDQDTGCRYGSSDHRTEERLPVLQFGNVDRTCNSKPNAYKRYQRKAGHGRQTGKVGRRHLSSLRIFVAKTMRPRHGKQASYA